ncbi:hypothetical protein SAMN05421736_1501, partial [Evansella caseinilytica]
MRKGGGLGSIDFNLIRPDSDLLLLTNAPVLSPGNLITGRAITVQFGRT